MCRRRSPSVMMPARRPSASTMTTQPKLLAVISTSASAMRVPSAHQRHGVAAAHDVAHELQHRAEPAARMQLGEFQRREAAALEQRDRERVAERLLHQGRGGGREIVRAGLARLRQRQHHVGGRAPACCRDWR